MIYKSTRIYLAYFKQFLKTRLSYRADFFASIFSQVMVAVPGLLFVVFLIDGEVVSGLSDWSREEVLFIYGYSLMTMAVFSIFSPNLYRFGDKYIIQGMFDRVLLRPLNSLFQVIFESFNLESFGSFIAGTAIVLYSANELDISFAFIDIAWIFVSVISGGVILIAVFVILSSLSFHFEDRLGIAPPVFNLIRFSRYPLPIYDKVIQFILKWVVPFAFCAFYPATHFFEKEGFEFLCYFTPFMAVICCAVAGLMWRFGVGKYSSVGN